MAKQGRLPKKNISHKIQKKRQQRDIKNSTDIVNRFELKINKVKHKVLNKKLGKHSLGRPGLSRSRAIKKREETILAEFRNRRKSNSLIDHRLGESDKTLTDEAKLMLRFAKERARNVSKNSKFALNDGDNELTHLGHSLSDIDTAKVAELGLSDEDDDVKESKRFSSQMVNEMFGGFNKKESSESAAHWKERMAEVISQSKKEKYERQSERERMLDLTEELDSEWKELSMLMSTFKGKGNDSLKSYNDDYDKNVMTMKFEARGKATNRLKTEDELAKEDKERLEKFEADRIRRMKGLLPKKEKPMYISADSLDNNFSKEASNDKDMLYYQDGKIKISQVEIKDKNNRNYKKGRKKIVKAEFSDSNDEELDKLSDGEDYCQSADDSGDDDDDEQVSEEDNSEVNEKEESDADLDGTDELGESDVSACDPLERFSDLESDCELAENNEIEIENNTDGSEPASLLESLMERKEMMKQAREEVPYTFEMPVEYEELVVLLQKWTECAKLNIVLERLRQNFHPSLKEGNKKLLEELLGLLIAYMCDLGLEDPPAMGRVNVVVNHISSMTRQFPQISAQHIMKMVRYERDQHNDYLAAHAGNGAFPRLSSLLLFQLVALLFPTSDKKHVVVTPALIHLCDLLVTCKIQNRRDIASGLFICSLVYEYVAFAKRYVPEVINFLSGVLNLALPLEKQLKSVGPFNSFSPLHGQPMLVLIKDKLPSVVCSLSLEKCFTRSQAKFLSTDQFRISAIFTVCLLLEKFNRLHASVPGKEHVFTTAKQILLRLSDEELPLKLKEHCSSVCDSLGHSLRLRALHYPPQKPTMIKSLEPRLSEPKKSKEHQEKKRLQHNYKKEWKGAIREVRKDSQFLSREKLKERMIVDEQRISKTKKIYADLAKQEGDVRSIKRKRFK